jgi:hypothetical protein
LISEESQQPTRGTKSGSRPSLEADHLKKPRALDLEADQVLKQIILRNYRAVESQGNISKPRAVKSEHLKKQPNLKNCDQALQPCHPKEPMRPGPLDQPLLLLSTRNLTSCSNKPNTCPRSLCTAAAPTAHYSKYQELGLLSCFQPRSSFCCPH